jgi:hypothetical protein
MVTFYPIVQAFTLPDFYSPETSSIVSFDSFFIRAALIYIDQFGRVIIVDSFNQKLMCCILVPSFSKQEINGVTILIDSPV